MYINVYHVFVSTKPCPPGGTGFAAGGPEARPEAAEAPAVSPLPLPALPMVLDAFRAALQSVGVRNLGTLKLDVEKVRQRDNRTIQDMLKRSEAWEHVETVTRLLVKRTAQHAVFF